MSGKPYLEGVKRVVEIINNLEHLDAEIKVLESHLPRLDVARRERSAEAEELEELLEAMDLLSQGNFGFGSRLGWFLRQMRIELRKG